MKLHLPVALLAAVLSTFAYGEETATTQPYSYTYVEKDGTGYSTFTGNGYGSLIADETSGAISAMNNYRNPNAGDPLYVSWKGAIGGIAANDHDDTAENVVIDVSGKDTWLSGVCGTGTTEYTITGDKTINITDGAYVQTVYGGSYERDVNTTGTTDSVTTISVSKGAMVTTILGGSFTSSNATGDLVTNDKVVINVNDAMVGVAKSGKTGELTYTAAEGLAIIGGSTYCSSINNDVEINVSGDSAVYGSIYAGTAAFRKQDASVNSTSVNINDGTVYGDVYGGGASGDYEASVLEGSKVAINGGTVTGNVYGAGSGDQIYGGTHVVVNGDATIHGDIYGGGIDGAEVKTGDRVITFDNHGEVDWTKVHDFDAVEFTGTTTTKLGTDGQLAENYKKVTIDNSYITGSIRDGHEVELDVTNNIHVALDGNLTTKAGSQIVDNENAITIGENATFNGTKIENSAIVAGGDIAVNSGSTVTNGNLVAADGNVSIVGSTMNGGEITVGGTLQVSTSQVKVDKIHGGEEIALNIYGTPFIGASSLEVNQDIKIAAGSQIMGWDGCFEGQQIGTPYNSSLTAKSITAEKKLSGNAQDIFCADFTATEGNVAIGGGNVVGMSNLVAKDSVVLKDGASLTHGSTATAQTGDVWLNGGVKVENSDLIAENGIVKFNQSTMNGGKIVAGEALQMDNASVVVADSINNGKAVKLDVNSGAYLNLSKEPTAASLTVNSDLVLADGSKFEGQKKVPYVTSDNNKDVEGLLTAHSIKSEGAVTFDLATVKATEGNIELATGSSVTNTNLVAKDSVQLNGTTMKGGSIDAGNKVVLNESEVSVNSIGKGGSAVVDSNKSQLEVTQGALVLDGGSVVKDSVLSSKEGVELRGTTMTGSTVKTEGKFSVIKGSDVTMDSVEGLKTIEISDSSFTTGKVELSKGETITSKTSNFTATDIVVNGGNFAADGTIKANSITVSDQGLIKIGDAKGTSKTQMELNATGSQSGLVSGKLEITNTDLVVTGSSSSQFWIDGGVMLVDGKSNVDLSAGTTLRVGSENAGELIVQGGSTLTGGANNLWVYDNSTINVSGEGSVMGVCNDKDHYNYRVLMGITNHDGAQGSATQTINVTDGGKFTSSATQFVTNFHGGTTTNITVSGKDSLFHQTGTNMNGGHYEVGTTGEWVKDKDGNWLDKGSAGVGGKYVTGNTDTITYLLSNGTDKNGVLGYAVADAKVNISAKDGGTVKFDSALTYVGNVGVNADYIEANKRNFATFTVGKDSSMSFKQMEVYANADVKNEGTFNATNINVNNGGIFNYAGSGKMTANSLGVDKGGVMNLGSETVRSNVELNNAGSGNSGVISGKLNVTNTNLVLTDSKAGAFWIDGGVMTVDGKSTVDLSNGGTLCVGRNDDGVLNVQGGSSLTGADNNLWVYGDSTINVTGSGSSMGVCKTEGDYNYRVLMGITNHDGPQNPVPVQEQNLNVKDGGTFTSSATQFVTNFHGNTTTNITVSGKDSLFHQTGQNVNNGHYVVGTTGEWVQNADGKWLDKGSTGDGKYVAGHGDTITYLLSNGTDKNGVLGYAVSNAKVNISAKDGGTVKFDSALTYVGNVAVSDAYIEANKSNLATFTVGDKASMSFKQMELYANTVIIFEKPVSGDSTSGSIGDIFNGSNADKYTTGGSFSADKITVHAGTKLDVKGNGTDSGSQFILTGTGKSNDEALVVDGTMNVNNANLVMKGTNSQLGIGYGADGGVLNVTNSKVDLSEGTTLHMGYNANTSNSVLNIKNSEFIGGSNNAWLGGGTINVTDNSTLSVCTGAEDHYNYRVLMGLSGNTVNLNVESGSDFVSSASQFVTNFNGGTTVNINVKGEGSTLVHNNEIESAPSYGITKTTTHLLDSGTDAKGNKYDAVNNVKTNITASEGGSIAFKSDVTYVGSAQDKAAGYTNKKLNITVADSASSVTFGDMVIYADTTIDNKGDKADFSAGNISVNDGATLETLGSLDLNEVALAGGELFNQGSLSMKSLELEHASLLFAATSLTDASAAIKYTGAQLTNFGPNGSSVSIDDMVDNFGIVLTGAGAQELIDAGETGVTFSFTLADYVGNGESDFESQLALVLNTKENLADFSITVGSAILREGDGELKNLKVEATENGVVISGTAIIPEPTTATLSLLALAALAARRRRK